MAGQITNPVSGNTQKIRSLLINGLTGALIGLFLGLFVISIVMGGIWALIIAMIGGSSLFVIGRCARILNQTMRGLTIGLFIGYLTSIIMLIWVGLQLDLSANLWAGASFVVTHGLLQVFISDSKISSWGKALFPHLISDDIQKRSN